MCSQPHSQEDACSTLHHSQAAPPPAPAAHLRPVTATSASSPQPAGKGGPSAGRLDSTRNSVEGPSTTTVADGAECRPSCQMCRLPAGQNAPTAGDRGLSVHNHRSPQRFARSTLRQHIGDSALNERELQPRWGQAGRHQACVSGIEVTEGIANFCQPMPTIECLQRSLLAQLPGLGALAGGGHKRPRWRRSSGGGSGGCRGSQSHRVQRQKPA